MARLNEIFTAFDALADKHGLEKIKTIGDAYMVVGGVPEARTDHAEAIARMALDMRAVVAAKRFGDERMELRIRIGIHSGPVVAGVIGSRKFSYDLWGDTVNVASRNRRDVDRGLGDVDEHVLHQLDGVRRRAWRRCDPHGRLHPG
jgi:adenylate cyclase